MFRAHQESRMRTSSRQRSFPSQAVSLLLAVVIAAPQLAEARFQPSHGFDLFSADEELQAGRQAAAQTDKDLPLLSDSDPVTKYVQQLGARLAAHAPGTKWPYNFHVVRQKEINAFALPGGPIYVNLGTIQSAENEAELAGVMAHEISHVVQRHATRAATKQMEAQLPLAILGGFLGKGLGGQLADLGINFGAQSYFLHNSRENEQQADLLGTDIMYDTGYDPHYMARFFEIIKQKYPSQAPQFLSDHPDPGNRIAYVSKEVNTLPAKSFTVDSEQFEQVKQRAAGMKAMTAQEIAQWQKQRASGSGSTMATGETVSSPAAASADFQEFQHADYTIGYPDNWHLSGDSSSAVTITPANGISGNAVAYGAIINGFQPEDPSSLDNATHELVAQLKQGNPDLREIGHDQGIKVNGVAGKSVDLVGLSPVKNQGGRAEPERDWLVTLPMSDNEHVLYVVFIAPEKDFGGLRGTFENMLRSLRLR
jgi:Zn-dependent protease with chaperone function